MVTEPIQVHVIQPTISVYLGILNNDMQSVEDCVTGAIAVNDRYWLHAG